MQAYINSLKPACISWTVCRSPRGFARLPISARSTLQNGINSDHSGKQRETINLETIAYAIICVLGRKEIFQSFLRF